MKLKKLLIPFIILFVGFSGLAVADETKWIAVGMLHDWFSSVGCEIEVGRRHLISDQQDGLRWPAQFEYQDCKASKALWIGATNYYDSLVDQTFEYKVVHVGPRVLDEANEFMPVEFKMIGRFATPLVYVDGIPASNTVYMDIVDKIDETLKPDRLIYNVVNTSIGITETRKIHAFSQQNHNNYFIYDYVFKNTGIIDQHGTEYGQTLEGVMFMFQYRYAPSREVGPYGYSWTPQSMCWGHCAMNDTMHIPNPDGVPLVCEFTYQGRHSKATFNTIGGPNAAEGGDGRLGAAHHMGAITLHADESAHDESHDPEQPSTTWYLGSDVPITSANDQFNAPQMAKEYAHMIKGHPPETHAQAVGDEYGDIWGGTPGGFTHCAGYGPYTLEPGDSIHIVIAEGISGLSRKACIDIGRRWLNFAGTDTLPDGSTTNDPDEYKDKWVFTGKDSLRKTFERAIATHYNLNYDIPQPPQPPPVFEITSGGDRVTLSWEPSPDENASGFLGYKIYRIMHYPIPDTIFWEEIFACGPGTDHPEIAHTYDDKTALRGFDYYYYITSFDDGSTNDINPGVSLESSMFYTMTNEPAYLRRQAGTGLEAIRIVPNPYNIKARDIQYGVSGPDRIMFLNIPAFCTIKIYTERGDLIKTIEHTDGSGDATWESVTSSRQVVVSGVYIAYFEVTEDYHDPVTGELLYKKGENAIQKFVIIR